MFILDGKPLSPDRAFTHNGVQYPANWLRLSSPAEKAALGITEAAAAPSYDQRFYWGVGNPKDLVELKAQWIQKQKDQARSFLAPTDWYVIRHMEHAGDPDCHCPPEVNTYRDAVRTVSNTRESEITAVTTVEELVELLNGRPTVYDFVTDQQEANPGLFLTPWPDEITIN
jgi:hypothetical protein